MAFSERHTIHLELEDGRSLTVRYVEHITPATFNDPGEVEREDFEYRIDGSLVPEHMLPDGVEEMVDRAIERGPDEREPYDTGPPAP